MVLVSVAVLVPISVTSDSEFSVCPGHLDLTYPEGTRFHIIKGEWGKYLTARKALQSSNYGSCGGGPIYKLYL